MRYFLFLIFTLFTICFHSEVNGQRYNFTNYTITNGLPGNNILSLSQDKNALLWVGTSNGVVVFDGLHFNKFTGEPVISNNPVNTIYQDSKGNVWLGISRKGVCKYDGTNFIYFNIDNGLVSDDVNCISGDNNGNIFIGTQSGLSKYDGKNISTLLFENNSLGAINDLCYRFTDNKLIIGGNDGLFSFDGNAINKTSDTPNIKHLSIKDDITYFSAGDSIFSTQANTTNLYYVYKSDVPSKLAGFNIDDKGKLTIYTKGNGFITNANESSQNYTTAQGLIFNVINDLLSDREGNIWIATQNGLSKFSGKKILRFRADEKKFSNKVLKNIPLSDSTSFTISQNGQIAIFDGNTFHEIANNISALSAAWCAIKSGSQILIGTTNGVISYDTETKSFAKMYPQLQNLVIHSIAQSSGGKFYFATDKGVYVAHENDVMLLSTKNGLPENKTRVVFCDSKETLWIGTMQGLYFIDGDSILNFNKKVKLATGPVTSFSESGDGKFAFGTFDFGVFIYNLNDATAPIVNIRQKDGLSNDKINCIFFEKNNCLWAGSENSFDKISFAGPDFSGIPVVEQFNLSTGYNISRCNNFNLDFSNNILVATDNGLIKINDAGENSTYCLPALRITSVQLFLKDFAWKKNGFDLNAQNGLPINPTLNYKQNHLNFTFKAIYFTAPQNILYSYLVQGIDDDWSPPTNHDIAYYPNMSNGDYVFKVRTSVNGKDWTTPVEFKFTIRAPWWRTKIAYLIYVLFIAGVVYGLLKLRTASLQKSKEILEQKIEERTKELNKTNIELEKLSLVARETDNAVLIFDENLNLEYSNHGFANLSGYTTEEIIALKGAHIRNISYNQDIDDILEKCLREHKSQIYESQLRHKEGSIVWTSSTMTPIFSEDNNLKKLVVIDTDISQRKHMEEQLKGNLEERSLLLREIHHRVKNNLQIIISLFNLQSYYVTDAYANKVLRDGQQRIKSMALIHEKFYQSEGLAKIDFKDYINRLSENLGMTYHVDKDKMAINITADDIALDIDTAVPCGLLLNEMLSNCFIHAFSPNDPNPEINIGFKAIDDGTFELSVSDNGKGLPDDFDMANSESLGMQLIQALTEQLDGRINYENDNGTRFAIVLKKATHS